MPFHVKEDEALDELDISLFSADAIMLETHAVRYLFKQRQLIGHEGNSEK
jgi:hypothetical protein